MKNNQLKPKKYSIVAYGTKENNNGDLLKVPDVKKNNKLYI